MAQISPPAHTPVSAPTALDTKPTPTPTSTRLDARWLQISWMLALLLIGVALRDFSLLPAQIALTFISALACQLLGVLWLKNRQARYLDAKHLTKTKPIHWANRLKAVRAQDMLSGIVTAFGVSLLVRADNLWVHPLVALLGIASKFILTVPQLGTPPPSPNPVHPVQPQARPRAHVFNPANLAAVMAAYVLPGAWLSPGQWGQTLWLSVLFCILGFAVTVQAKRWDVALAFIGTFTALLLLRVWWIEARIETVWHTLQNGSLLLFTFFMISDPMTTPQRKSVRIGFAALVAALAFAWQYTQFKPNGPVLALFAASWIVPLLNRLWPAPRFAWR